MARNFNNDGEQELIRVRSQSSKDLIRIGLSECKVFWKVKWNSLLDFNESPYN